MSLTSAARGSLAAMFIATFPPVAQQPKPDPDRLKADAARLEKLEPKLGALPLFSAKFWRVSREVADERGPHIIHALMERARTWKGEEGLLYVPLVALLPREPTLELLRQYQRSKRKSDRIYAAEFLTELDFEDVREGVRRYSKRK